MNSQNGQAEYSIVVENLTKSFDQLVVLNDVNFKVKQGEFLSIVGPTGCGKTTFMNTLAKLTPATSGRGGRPPQT
jgi:ABC-type sugar transport system ATPase subunit